MIEEIRYFNNVAVSKHIRLCDLNQLVGNKYFSTNAETGIVAFKALIK